MEPSTVEQRVVRIIGEALKEPPEKLTSETRFLEDLGADSLDLATLVMALEEEFNETIPEDQLPGLTTVGAVVELIAAHATKAR